MNAYYQSQSLDWIGTIFESALWLYHFKFSKNMQIVFCCWLPPAQHAGHFLWIAVRIVFYEQIHICQFPNSTARYRQFTAKNGGNGRNNGRDNAALSLRHAISHRYAMSNHHATSPKPLVHYFLKLVQVSYYQRIYIAFYRISKNTFLHFIVIHFFLTSSLHHLLTVDIVFSCRISKKWPLSASFQIRLTSSLYFWVKS